MTKGETNLSESVQALPGAPFPNTDARSTGKVSAGEWLAPVWESFRGEVSLSFQTVSEGFGKFCGKAEKESCEVGLP